ncbi:unnamed protein product [Haemonchus placei]|uniref:EMI domain-containing protein n=1 Tax=Haemonchus placei TaxID=6290 RepID=A0A0N4XAB1_HAEPC|nr:unnamed protein product [Haemonchus placei]
MKPRWIVDFLTISALATISMAASPARQEPTGPNVCTVPTMVDEYKLEKVYRPVEYTEYETCLDVSKGFRCPVVKKGGRFGYENKLVKVEKYVKACCEGYYQTKDNVCKPCSVGLWGPSCQRKCECDNGANCDPETGACICEAGFMGVKCEQECPPDRYGPNCTEKCLCQNGGR